MISFPNLTVTEITMELASPNPSRQAYAAAYADVVINDCLAINGIRLIIRRQGKSFIAMPSKLAMSRCHGCGSKNSIASSYCNRCGVRLLSKHGTEKSWDIVFPTNPATRQIIESAVITEYQRRIQSGT